MSPWALRYSWRFSIHGREIVINFLFLSALTVFGLIFGSFANVVIWRFPRGESLSHPDSHCPACDTRIQWRDNIPVLSWLALRGRCRTCGVRISSRYPLVELTSGLLWLAAGVRFGVTFQTVAAIAFFYLLMILAFIDLDTMRLPNTFVALLTSIGFLGAVVSHFAHVPVVPLLVESGFFGSSPLLAAVAGALVCSVPALILSLVMSTLLKRPALGMGDVKLLGVIGIFLGTYGLLAFFVGSIVGSVYGVGTARWHTRHLADDVNARAAAGGDGTGPGDMTTRDPKGLGSPFPFGPALALGAVIVTLVGPQMWHWYQSLFLA